MPNSSPAHLTRSPKSIFSAMKFMVPEVLPRPSFADIVGAELPALPTRALSSECRQHFANAAANAGEDRRVAQRVLAHFVFAHFHDEIDEVLGFVALERDHKLRVVETETINGVDLDARVSMPGLNVDVHHPLAFFLREQVPLAGFPEGIDEDVFVLARDNPAPTTLAAFMFVVVH